MKDVIWITVRDVTPRCFSVANGDTSNYRFRMRNVMINVASSYRYVWSAAELQAKKEERQLVCANVFGL